MPRQFWWPTSMSDQLVLITNFNAKIAGYQATLGLTAAQVTAAQAICDTFISAFSFAEQSKQTMQSVTQWRDLMYYSPNTGEVAPPPPIFPIGQLASSTTGLVRQFFDLRDLIVALPGYSMSIGEDLQIIGPEKAEIIPSEVAPELKTIPVEGYTVELKGSMQGMSVLKVEYAPKGGDFAPVAYLTNLPGSFQVTPAVPGEPQSGQVRAVFIKKNAQFGNYSPNYPVTVS